MAKKRRKKSTDIEVEIIEVKTPCDLANEKIKSIYGGGYNINRELYEELSQYRERPTTTDVVKYRKWLLGLNNLSKIIRNKMISDQGIKSMCGSCGSAKSYADALHIPMMKILEICDSFNSEIK